MIRRLAAIAAFFWGFLYSGLNPIPYKARSSAEDDEAAAKALPGLLQFHRLLHDGRHTLTLRQAIAPEARVRLTLSQESW